MVRSGGRGSEGSIVRGSSKERGSVRAVSADKVRLASWCWELGTVAAAHYKGAECWPPNGLLRDRSEAQARGSQLRADGVGGRGYGGW